ncbi:heavy-metal-associated domain-containing protein [Ghiorsea bivora]|uniref:heavy-metal-associated domain-containing protein n=1 Tax=Ghiorsea bivora TaxID=1485545 RepID=UPI000571C132|nr:heavy-metal-associated domain-containing protein [Ghiorsea bivora]
MRILQSIFVITILSIMSLNTLFAEGVKAQTVTIQVDGLSCPFCAYGLEKNLKKIEGIEAVKIDMKTGKATITIQENMGVTDQSLRQAVKKAGFTARDITRQ